MSLPKGCQLLRLSSIQQKTAPVYYKTSIMADVVVDRNFPSDCLVPKNETGVVNFLKKYPNYNGDGVTIAILDSGVDPKATGLDVSHHRIVDAFVRSHANVRVSTHSFFVLVRKFFAVSLRRTETIS